MTGAASYTIQIDDSSAFTAPLVRDADGDVVVRTSRAACRPRRSSGACAASTPPATPGAWSATRSFTPQAAPPPTALTNLDVNPSTVAGGDASSGTVIVSVAAPDTTVVSAVEQQPRGRERALRRVTVPTGGFTGTFTIATSAVAASTTVTITAVATTARRGPPP